MRAVVQRVSSASVTVKGEVTGAIERGLLVYLGPAARIPRPTKRTSLPRSRRSESSKTKRVK